MKSAINILFFLVIIILSSCQSIRWGNFNKQKFTKLKTIKTEYPKKDIGKVNEEEGVKNQSGEVNSSVTPELIVVEIDDSTEEFSKKNTEPESNTEQQINHALEYGFEIIINVNGRKYFLTDKNYDQKNQLLYGDLENPVLLPKNSKVLELKAGDYDIIRLNTLKVKLEEIDVIVPIEIENQNAEIPETDEIDTNSKSDDNSNESNTEKPEYEDNKIEKKSSIYLIIAALVLLGLGITFGGTLLGLLLIPSFVLVFIAIAISINKKPKRQKTDASKVSTRQIEQYRQKTVNQFLGSLVCLAILIIGVIVGFGAFELLGLFLALGAWIIGFPLLTCSAINSRKYRLSSKAIGNQQDGTILLIRVFTWIGLFIFGSIPFLIPFFISLGIIQSKTR